MTDRMAYNRTLRPVAKRKIGLAKTPKARKGIKRKAEVKGAAVIERLLGEGKVFKASSFKSKPRKKMKHRAKGASGQKALFIDIFRRRGPTSQVSGLPLVDIPDGDGKEYELHWKAFLRQFSHILPKGAYKKAMLDEENIVIKTGDEHELWETKKWTLRELPEWQWVFALEERLKEKYNLKPTIDHEVLP